MLMRAGDMVAFVGRTIYSVRLTRPRVGDVLDQTLLALRLGWRPVLAFMMPVGMAFAFNLENALGIFGLRTFAGGSISPLVVKAIGAPFVAIIMAAVVGAAFAADVGARKIHDELDASSVMGVSSLARLAVPKIVAMVLVSPVLLMLGLAAALVGGYALLVVLRGANAGIFIETFVVLTKTGDLAQAIGKIFVISVVIGLAACYFGYQAEGGPAGVAKRVRQSIIFSIVATFFLDYVMSSIFFALS